MNPEPSPDPTPETVKATQPARRRHIPCLAQGCVLFFVVGVLASVFLPYSNSVCVKGPQTKSLAQAKQIGLMLKIFAGDHDGNYPRQGVPTEMTKAPTTANAAFACLFPIYTTSERIFGNKLSAYQTRQSDDVIDNPYTGTPVKTLEPGENVYAYVAGLTEESPPDAPIVLDGTDGSFLYYNSNPALRGGVWGGKKAVVIYLDNHGAVETLSGRENTRYVAVDLPGRPKNLLDLSWLGGDVHLLNPAVAP